MISALTFCNQVVQNKKRLLSKDRIEKGNFLPHSESMVFESMYSRCIVAESFNQATWATIQRLLSTLVAGWIEINYN